MPSCGNDKKINVRDVVNRISNRAPIRPFSHCRVPPWASTISRAIARPSPLPFERDETKGSKICSLSSSGTPDPESSTAISNWPLAVLAVTFTHPFGGVCCRALATKLWSARDSCCSSNDHSVSDVSTSIATLPGAFLNAAMHSSSQGRTFVDLRVIDPSARWGGAVRAGRRGDQYFEAFLGTPVDTFQQRSSPTRSQPEAASLR
jgi:hypothetical protein